MAEEKGLGMNIREGMEEDSMKKEIETWRVTGG